MISPSQKPLPDNTQHSNQTDIHAPDGIQTRNRSKRAAEDPRLRPRGHWDRQNLLFRGFYLIFIAFQLITFIPQLSNKSGWRLISISVGEKVTCLEIMINIICINNIYGRLCGLLEGKTATHGTQTIYKLSDARSLACNGHPV